MISLTCTHCQTVLSIDEGFAGGVCRCQHCGTIQTVPSHLKKGNKAPVSTAVGADATVAGARMLYQAQGRPDDSRLAAPPPGSGTGLEDLAQVVASSGLAGSGLRRGGLRVDAADPTAVPATAPARSRNMLYAIIGAAVVIAIIAIVAVSSLNSHAPSTPAALLTVAPGAAPTPAASPNCCGLPITGDTVIYILDRGSSARDLLPAMKEATYRSIASLGSDRKFQITFWDNGSDAKSYPGAPNYATADNIETARRALDDVTAFGQSSLREPLAQALKHSPDAVVILTAKGGDLDADFLADTRKTLGDSPVRLYALSIGTDSNALQTLASTAHGAYKEISQDALNAAAGAN